MSLPSCFSSGTNILPVSLAVLFSFRSQWLPVSLAVLFSFRSKWFPVSLAIGWSGLHSLSLAGWMVLVPIILQHHDQVHERIITCLSQWIPCFLSLDIVGIFFRQALSCCLSLPRFLALCLLFCSLSFSLFSFFPPSHVFSSFLHIQLRHVGASTRKTSQ